MLRYLLCTCLVLAGCASSKQVKTYTDEPIVVSCDGRTFELAKKQCFDNAIEYAVGAVVVSQAEVKNKSLVKNEILKHSAGYVDSYDILGRDNDYDKISLSMRVKVRSSKIAERILNVSASDGTFDGQKLSSQYSTYKDSRDSGDAVLRTVLDSYPKHAYDIKQINKVEFKLDKDRNVYIIVPFQLKWNYKFLTALNEALEITSDGSNRGYIQDIIAIQSKDPDAWIAGSTNKYYFNDRTRADMIQKKLLGRITVKAIIKNNQGRAVFVGCADAYHHGTNVVYPYIVRGTEMVQNQIMIKVKSNSPKMRDLDSASNIELSFSSSLCYNYEQ